MAPMNCYHHIPSDRDQQLEEGVMGVGDVVAQNPAPPPVHLIFVHILVHGKSSSVHFFANLIKFHLLPLPLKCVSISHTLVLRNTKFRDLVITKVGKTKGSAGWQDQMKMNLDLDLLPGAIPIPPLPSHQHLQCTKLKSEKTFNKCTKCSRPSPAQS